MTQAHLGDIRAKIIDLLDGAQVSIKVGMAWFTNEAIFKILLNKAAAGQEVKIVISDSPANFYLLNTNSRKIDFSRLIKKGGEVRVAETFSNKFFHNKYAIVDGNMVITGSYNWSLAAETNHENIIVTDDLEIVRHFSAKHRYFEQAVAVTYDDFIARLQPTGNQQMISAEKADDETYMLAQEFEQLVQQNISTAAQIGLTVNFDRLQAKISQYTAVGAARKLSNAPAQTGFINLAALHKLQLSFEYLVTRPKFAVLFDTITISNAKLKLKEYGFDI